MSIVAKKYARAIFECGQEQSKLEHYAAEFSAIEVVLEQSAFLRRALVYPRIKPAEKVQILEKVCELHFSREVANLLALLFERGRAKELMLVSEEFARLMKEYESLLEVQVASAIDLPVQLEGQLHQRLEQLTGKRVSLRKVTDPALIGGMVITIGDRVIDGSIKSALQTLSKKLAYHS